MTTDAARGLPPDDGVHGRLLDARLHLEDRQLVDPDEVPIATVDDLELEGVELGRALDPEHPAHVSALLSGPVLWARIFGGPVRRDRFDEVPWRDVTEMDVAVHVSRPASSYDASWGERWVADRVIGRIPGGRDAPE